MTAAEELRAIAVAIRDTHPEQAIQLVIISVEMQRMRVTLDDLFSEAMERAAAIRDDGIVDLSVWRGR